MADPDDIHTREDLQRALGELYARAHISYVKLTEQSGVTASGNTIHGWVHGTTFPQWANLSPVLRAWDIADDELGAWKDAHKRADADARSRPGLPLDEVRDPFALEVHEPITATDFGVGAAGEVLPPYVRRAHDDRLAEVVDDALAGNSGIAALLGDSSTGKTRALWQALGPLRASRGWRLWHPSPYHPENLREQLDKVGPRTVVWLNETQRYFLPASELDRGRLAEQLRTMLTNKRRAPILILGSLWHEHYKTLCADAGSATHKLLELATIPVPEKFTGADLAAMRAIAGEDLRLAMALARAENGKITQYLAGGPALIHFYRKHASVPGQAVIEAAMDAVRLGHPNVLPFTLLRDIGAEYIDDITWDSLDEDTWFQAALDEIRQESKGARGPVTPIKERPSAAHTARRRARRASGDSGPPVYQLADYLDQHGRRTRAQLTPPLGFWDAVAAHADPDHQNTLGDAAWDRGLYREAAQLWKNAIGHGHAALKLVTRLSTLFPGDYDHADWVAAHVPLDDLHKMGWLIGQLWEVGARTQVQALVDRVVAHAPLDRISGVAALIGPLWQVGAHTQMQELVDRAAANVGLDNIFGVAALIGQLRSVGAHTQMQALVDRAVACTPLDNISGVAALIGQLQEVGAHTQIQKLMERAAADVHLDDLPEVAWLIGQLRQVGAHAQMQALMERVVAHSPLHSISGVAALIRELQEVGAHTQMQELVDRAAGEVGLDNIFGVAALIDQLRRVGAHTQMQALVDRAVAHAPLDNISEVSCLIDQLRRVGAHSQMQELMDRAAADAPLDDLPAVAGLIDQLRRVGAHTQIQALVDRAVACTPLDNISGVAALIGRLQEVGAHSQMQELMDRAAADAPLDDLPAVAGLID
ncbi:hypothetical protein ACFV24_16220, partial [Nocardia fluminea]|uniref:hypothetical protein n=1 Tax=Nocardia fluminea TaxID=134984 RepID=UPI00366FCB99